MPGPEVTDERRSLRPGLIAKAKSGGKPLIDRDHAFQAAYSGWDLVVDREPAAGFPDALLLATLPYNSINEREIGTTFGLRAQDAIGWNPRSFRFIVTPSDFREAQQLFRSLSANARPAIGESGDPRPVDRQAGRSAHSPEPSNRRAAG